MVLSRRAHIAYSTATHTRAVFLLTAEKRMEQGCVAPSHYGLGSVGLLLWVPSPNQMLAALLLSQDGFGTAKVNDKTNLLKEEIISGVDVPASIMRCRNRQGQSD